MGRIIGSIFVLGVLIVVFGWIIQFLEKYGMYIVYSLIGLLCVALIYKFIGFKNSKRDKAINKISDDFFDVNECPTKFSKLNEYFDGYLDDVIEQSKDEYSYIWIELFQNAVKNSDLDTAEYLLSKNIDVDFEEFYIEAIEENNTKLIDFLIKNDIYDKYDILKVACEHKLQDIVQYCMEEILILDDEKGNDLLIIAARNDQYYLCKFLIEMGADINTTDEDGDTVLHNAVYFENIDIVRYLIDNGAYINLKNNNEYTPYDYAKSKKNNAIIEIIIENDIDNKTKYLQEKIILSINNDDINELKSTIDNIDDISLITQDILLYCQEHQKHDALYVLIKNGACLISYLQKFLLYVYYEDQTNAEKMFESIFRHTPSLEICDEDETTPLILAIEYDKLDWVKYLVKNGANIYATKKFFKEKIPLTPLEIAEFKHHDEIADFLKDFIENKKKNLSVNKFDLNDKTFRLFISSTFSDFKKEREILHKNVFPEITKYCDEKNLNFQPIDLRWGVSSEAQLDQKTMQLCLDEVRACKTFPHPNFIILAGDRYGYIPCPYMIEKKEFESLLDFIKDEEYLSILKYWYRLDENQIFIKHNNKKSAAYILQPRTGKYTNRDNWKREENILRKSLQESANEFFEDKKSKEYLKYFTSATEAEVIEGISHYGHKTKFQENYDEVIDKDYVFAYIRTIQNPSDDYVDSDKYLSNSSKDFKEKISTLLAENNKLENTFNSVEDYTKNDLKDFEKYFIEKIKYSIDEYLLKINDINSLDFELSEQIMYKESKIKNFKGKDKTLQKIEKYISHNNDYKEKHYLEDNEYSYFRQPMVIYGESGMGKSALLAKSIDCISSNIKYKNNTILFRFIGATANSISLYNFLVSLCDELQYLNIIDPIKKPDNVEDLEKQVMFALSDVKRETIIYIDAIDQLEDKSYLRWIPSVLSNKLKIIITVLNDKNYIEDSHYYNLFKDRLKTLSGNLLDISNDSLEDSKKDVLKSYLSSYSRTLNKSQRKFVLSKWEKTGYSPLYLKIIVEDIKNWTSYNNEYELKDNTKDAIIKYIDNLNNIYHFDKTLSDKVLGYIQTSRFGLSEKELLEILSHDLEDEKEFRDSILNDFHEPIKYKNVKRNNQDELILPISIWSRLNTQLKPFLVLRSNNNQKLMKFFHRQFETVIEELIENNKIEFHQKLSDYFYLLQNKSKTWNERYSNLHMLDEYLYHLIHSDNIDKLRSTIFDLEFIGSIYDNYKHIGLRKDLLKMTEMNLICENKIYPLESFLIENEYKIINDKVPHEKLFKLAYYDGENSPLSLNADKILANKKVDFDFKEEKERPKEFTRSGLIKVINRENKKSLTGDKIKELNNSNICIFNEKELRVFDNKLNFLYEIHNKKSLPISGVEVFEDNKILTYDSFNIFIWNDNGELFASPVRDEEDWIDEVIIINNDVILYQTDKIVSLHNIKNHNFAYLNVLSTMYKMTIRGIKLFSQNIVIVYYSSGVTQLFDIDKFINNNLTCYGETINTDNAIQAHDDSIRGIEIIDKKYITYSADQTLKIWNYENDTHNELKGHSAPISCVKVIENMIWSCADNGSIALWSSEGDIFKVLQGHDDRINNIIEFDNKVLTYSNDKKLKIWSKEGECLKVLEGHENNIQKVEVLPNGEILSFEMEEGKYVGDPIIYLWDKDGNLKGKLNNLKKPIKVLSNKNIIISYKDNTLKLWSSLNLDKELQK